jgi:hypothetical protein
MIGHHAPAKLLHLKADRLCGGHSPELDFGETIAGRLP